MGYPELPGDLAVSWPARLLLKATPQFCRLQNWADETLFFTNYLVCGIAIATENGLEHLRETRKLEKMKAVEGKCPSASRVHWQSGAHGPLILWLLCDLQPDTLFLSELQIGNRGGGWSKGEKLCPWEPCTQCWLLSPACFRTQLFFLDLSLHRAVKSLRFKEFESSG